MSWHGDFAAGRLNTGAVGAPIRDDPERRVFVIRNHHERFDGGGYPDGLCGHKIPLLARIVSVCDAYDALASDRPYRVRRDPDETIETLMRGAGQQWDRELVSILLSELPTIRFGAAAEMRSFAARFA